MAEVLVIGSGGREAALAEAMGNSAEVSRVEVASDVRNGLERFSGAEKPFVVIGPEKPLVEGLADDLREDGYVVFGVGKEGAQYEASKSRTIKMARRAGIVHPPAFITEGKSLKRLAPSYVVRHLPEEYVIKADGLAGGKGVVVPDTQQEAREAVTAMIEGDYDGAGKEIIIFQRRHHGPEVSAMVVVGGGKDDFAILPLAQDHKRLLDNDEGPNTGGMGAYAPVPRSIVNSAQYEKIREKASALLDGMKREGVHYERAVMYMGLMMSRELKGVHPDESDLIEINVRFGDPETQSILPLLTRAGVDAYRLLRSAAEGSLELPDGIDFANAGSAAVSVCLAVEGYPDSASVKQNKGSEVQGLREAYEDVVVQLAGVRRDGEDVYTDGGRVLYVTGLGETVNEAATKAYAAIGEEAIHFSGMHYRHDIARQAR